MNLTAWAIKWGVPAVALADLQNELGLNGAGSIPEDMRGQSEAAAQAAVRVEAGQKKIRLWRNNVGALQDSRGVPVRYGLANDSAALNKVLKSGDLIGIRPVVITPLHVGATIGQFVSREMKAPGWRYTGTAHEEAQQRWALLVSSLGGDAGFATGAGTL
jgi:hypothetical protein